MNTSTTPTRAIGGGGSNITRAILEVRLEGGDMTLIAEQRAILTHIFETLRTAWATTNDVVLGGICNQNMRAIEALIQECDLKITRLIEVQGSYRQDRMNDDDLPF